uniref:Chromatin assembly factor 1 P55 subunit n=1 Tax=Piliocolobus tephrosceles TaxID=591936 RepID=A0A8C9HAZ8_9PRIM
MQWSHQNHFLTSCADDAYLCIWDINGGSTSPGSNLGRSRSVSALSSSSQILPYDCLTFGRNMSIYPGTNNKNNKTNGTKKCDTRDGSIISGHNRYYLNNTTTTTNNNNDNNNNDNVGNNNNVGSNNNDVGGNNNTITTTATTTATTTTTTTTTNTTTNTVNSNNINTVRKDSGRSNISYSFSDYVSTNCDNSQQNIIYPLMKFYNNNVPLQDCCWRENSILTVSDDGYINIYDIRSKSVECSIKAATRTLTTVDVNPHNTNIYATGGANKEIDLWDIRYFKKSLHRIITQKDTIIKLQWDKHQPGILSSSSNDNNIYFFDTNRIGIEQSYDDSQDGPPELIFIHGGHSSSILDYSLSLNYSMMIASVSEDNILQIWQPSKQTYE